jgi:hypothetical protein
MACCLQQRCCKQHATVLAPWAHGAGATEGRAKSTEQGEGERGEVEIKGKGAIGAAAIVAAVWRFFARRESKYSSSSYGAAVLQCRERERERD